METIARVKGISVDYSTGETLITFATSLKPDAVETHLAKLKDKICELVFKAKEKRRSKDANALMWHCLQEIANVQMPPTDKWTEYLRMLKKYGQFTYIACKPEAVEAMRKQWRETQIVGEIENQYGETEVQMLCFFGSHTYTVEEFRILLDGIIQEMISEGLQPPTSKEMQIALDKWNEKCNSEK